MVKNDDGFFCRKGYMKFDLKGVLPKDILSAELLLTIFPSHFGNTILEQKADFTVYGLKEEKLDNWNSKTINWKTAPGNNDGNDTLETNQTIKLGSFSIGRGIQTGQRQIKTLRLLDFLKTNKNELATIIIVRNTKSTQNDGLVHAFSGCRNPTAPAPALILTMKE